MELYNETHKVIKAIRKRFNVYHEIPCTADDRRVQEIISIVVQTIEALPSADVSPKSDVDLYRKQVDELEDELASTYDKLKKAKVEADKWKQLFYDAKKVIGENAQQGLEVTLEEVEKAKAEVAREIFEDIESVCLRHVDRYNRYLIYCEDFSELKKKYVEEKT